MADLWNEQKETAVSYINECGEKLRDYLLTVENNAEKTCGVATVDSTSIRVDLRHKDESASIYFMPEHDYVVLSPDENNKYTVPVAAFTKNQAGWLADIYAIDVEWVRQWCDAIVAMHKIVQEVASPPVEPPAATPVATPAVEQSVSATHYGPFTMTAAQLAELRDSVADALERGWGWEVTVAPATFTGDSCLSIRHKPWHGSEYGVDILWDVRDRQVEIKYCDESVTIDMANIPDMDPGDPQLAKLALCDSWFVLAGPRLAAAAINTYDYLCDYAHDLLLHTPDGLVQRVIQVEDAKFQSERTASDLLVEAANKIEKLEKTVKLQGDLLRHLM